MRQFVRPGLIAFAVAGLVSVAGAQTPNAGQTGKAATKTAAPPRPAILDQVLATVNGETINREDLYRMLDATGVPPGADDEASMYRIGIEGLVNSKLVKQYLKKQAAIIVTEKDIDAEFADFTEKMKKDGQDVYVALASHGVTVPHFREEMSSTLRWRKYIEAVSNEENLKKFVAENKDMFNRTQVQASHIVLRVDPEAPAADKEKAKQKLLSIKREVDANKLSFADAANKYSEDEGNKSSPRGGDLGYFVRKGQFNEQFSTAAFGLKKGMVSEPIETPFGFHLILVTDRKEGDPIDFKQNNLLIRSEYAADVHERIVAAERRTAKIKIEPMPADLFPKAQPGAAAGAPAEAGKSATTPAKAATPK